MNKIKLFEISFFKNKSLSGICFFMVLFFSNLSSFAQDNLPSPEMADFMRSNGKIYVVVGVLLIIFIGIISYLVILNNKLNSIEKKLNQSEK